MLEFENILEEIGSFGLYQKLLCFLLIPFTTGLVALTYYVQIFILTAPPHLCRLRGEKTITSNKIYDETNHTSILLDHLSALMNVTAETSEAPHPMRCHQYPANLSSTTLGINFTDSLPNDLTSLVSVPTPSEPCTNGWDYDYNVMFQNYASEQNLVCNESWRPYMVITAFWIGNTIGSWIWGIVSDTCGRRPTIAIIHLIYGVAGFASVFVDNFTVFLALRVLVGSAHHTVTHLPFVLVVEYCGMNSRAIPLLVIMMSYTCGSILTPVLAWFLWDWRILLGITSAPAVLVFLLYKIIPESSSWLLTRGRGSTALRQLETVAKVNKRKMSPDTINDLLSIEPEDPKENKNNRAITAIFVYPSLRKNVFFVLVVWMLSCMCYYGHCQNTANLSSNLFMSFLLGSLVEIPAWGGPFLINRFGRRPPLFVALVLSGTAGIVYAMLPEDSGWLSLGIALFGRMTITCAYYITLQYGPEIFPTVVRGQGVAMSETMGGIAIFLSPSIVYLSEVHHALPLMVFGGLSLLGAAVTLLLPETMGVALPQTLEQAEIFCRKSGTCFSCGKSEKDVHNEELAQKL
ncbi:solute carrier family 22 member 13-like [Oratosquilla oratoria]|uniref:solute carrier family 22 member 13-like n=1 Tax=Oratosquilla oratoria TaxID=337810 RepID=UPI003F75CDE1